MVELEQWINDRWCFCTIWVPCRALRGYTWLTALTVHLDLLLGAVRKSPLNLLFFFPLKHMCQKSRQSPGTTPQNMNDLPGDEAIWIQVMDLNN